MYTLITAATSSGAYNLKNTLDADKVLLGDYFELPEILVRSGKMIQLPQPGSVSYTHQMLALCLDKNIDTIHVLRKAEADLLLKSKTLFCEYGIDILAADDPL